MRRKLIGSGILLSIAISAICALVILASGCNNKDIHYDEATHEGAVVTFCLEGGIYKNSKNDVKYYYTLSPGQTVHIASPQTYSKKDVEWEGGTYSFEGWYKTKSGEGDEAVYSDPWDFENDSVGYGDRITLYANWVPVLKYTYSVCYKDEEGETVVLGSYSVKEGVRFNDYRHFANTRTGYTALPGFYDENDEPWDSEYKHPGGEEDTDIKVYVHYVEGNFKLISTVSELNSVRSSENVYLLNDIDFNGATLRSLNNYGGIFLGNNHTVSNFNINRGTAFNGDYGRDDRITDSDLGTNVLCISIFGCSAGAQVSDVRFTGVTADINVGYRPEMIYVAPLFVKLSRFAGNAVTAARDGLVKNVTFEGTYTITNLPDEFDRELLVISDKPCYLVPEGDGSSVEGCDISFTEAAAQPGAANVEIDMYFINLEEKKEY